MEPDVRVHDFGAPGTCIRLRAHGVNVVLGRRGAGRTSLCRLIAGLDPAGPARVCFGDHDVTGLDTRRRNVGLVFAEFVNYPSLTVAENIASPLRAANVSAAERTCRVADMAARVGLEGLLDRLPEALSGGQQQRVALARALVKAPAVLLLDEPLANLDYKLRESLQEELRTLFADTDTVVLYTTSDPREAMNLADHVVLLDAGIPIQQDAPLALLRAPATPTAADLLCDPGINLAQARVVGERLLLAPLGAAGDSEPVDLPCPARLLGAGRFLLAIRPDHLQPAEADDPAGIDATVLLGETSGSDTYLHVRLEPTAASSASAAAPAATGVQGGVEWVVHLDGLHSLQPGSRLRLAVNPRDLLAFPEDAPRPGGFLPHAGPGTTPGTKQGTTQGSTQGSTQGTTPGTTPGTKPRSQPGAVTSTASGTAAGAGAGC